MLVNKFGAIYAKDGFEADDELADEARMLFNDSLEEDYVICTIDKDLDTVPGWHYRWAIYNKPSSYYWVTPEESRHHYWVSVLTGDNADNIIGLKGIGPKKAEKILAECETDYQYERACEQAYIELYNGPYEPDMQMEKNMQLLYLGTDRHGF
jgi:5'-3' exonuclease